MAHPNRKFDSMWKLTPRSVSILSLPVNNYGKTGWVRQHGFFRTAINASRDTKIGMAGIRHFVSRPWDTWTPFVKREN